MKYGVICFVNGKIASLNDADLGVFDELTGLDRYCEREYFSYFDKKTDLSRNNGPKNTSREIKYRGSFTAEELEALVVRAELAFKVEEVISSLGENDLKSIGIISADVQGLSSAVAYNSRQKNVNIEANVYPLADNGQGFNREDFIKIRNELISKYGDENAKASVSLHYGIKIKQVRAKKKKVLYVKNQYKNVGLRVA